MIVLHERIDDTKIRELLLMVGFHKKSTGAMKNLRAKFPNARNREFIFLQRIHALVKFLLSLFWRLSFEAFCVFRAESHGAKDCDSRSIFRNRTDIPRP